MRPEELDMTLVATYEDGTAPGTFRLWVGSLRASGAYDPPVIKQRVLASLRAHGVGLVVNCCTTDLHRKRWAPFADEGMQYAFVRTDDYNVSEAENPAAQWAVVMEQMRAASHARTGVLVHCYAGVNRSVTTAALFLALHGLAPDVPSAVALIRAKRRVADPYAIYVQWAQTHLSTYPQRYSLAAVPATAPTAPLATAPAVTAGAAGETDEADEAY
jgi:protein-tyrosine phosphatase